MLTGNILFPKTLINNNWKSKKFIIFFDSYLRSNQKLINVLYLIILSTVKDLPAAVALTQHDIKNYTSLQIIFFFTLGCKYIIS